MSDVTKTDVPAIPQDVPGLVEPDDEAKKIIADAMGIQVSDLDSRKMRVTPEFLDKLKSGKVKIVPKPAQATDPGVPMEVPKAFEPPNPRALIESRYLGVLKKAAAIRKTSGLPPSSKNMVPGPSTAALAGGAMPNDQKPVLSVFMEFNSKLNHQVLAVRPPGAPSILQECRTPIKLMICQHQSPGDIMMLTRAVDDLHKSYPGSFITCMKTPCMEIWENNPNYTKIEDNDAAAMWYSGEYKLINTSTTGSHHFCHGFRKDLEAKLGIPIDQTFPYAAIYISAQEKSWWSQIYEITKKNLPFWIIDAGRKSDYTAKLWDVTRFQAVIDAFPDITWVQIGASAKDHYHPELRGANVINLIGKTSIRQMIRLMYHAAGVITPVSFPMHLAAAVEMHPRFKRKARPCIVLCGGREPAIWEAYTTHQFLHTGGMLPCCDNGACWASRVEPLGDGDEKDYRNLCKRPVQVASGQIIPQCMEMISAERVIEAVRGYLVDYDYSGEDTNWKPRDHVMPEALVKKIADIEAKTKAGEIKKKDENGRIIDSAATPEVGKELKAAKTDDRVLAPTQAPPEPIRAPGQEPGGAATPEEVINGRTRQWWQDRVWNPKDWLKLDADQFRYCEAKYSIAARIQPQSIVEIGVRYGYSAAAFLTACPKVEYKGIDVLSEKGLHGGEGNNINTFEWVGPMLKRIAPEAHVTLMHQNSQMMSAFPPADMYHVDGDHTYMGGLADVVKAFAAVNPGGVVVVDDYTFYKDVGRAVDDFVKANADGIEKTEFVKSLRGDFLIWKKGGKIKTVEIQAPAPPPPTEPPKPVEESIPIM